MPNVPYERESAATHTDNLIAWALGLAQSTAGRLTDFNIGSKTRNLLETIAIRLEHLDSKVFGGLRRAIPTVLYEFFGPGDGITSSVGFPLIPAVAAAGIVRYQRRPGVLGPLEVTTDGLLTVIPQGSTLAERLYRVIVPATMAADADFVDTLAQAVDPGSAGNTPANTMTLKTVGGNVSLTGLFLGATNPAAFLSGQDAETSEQRRLRFVQFIRNLARAQHGGLEVAAYQAMVILAGLVIERVLSARSVDVPEKRGLVDVYVDNGGGGASPGLVAAVQELLDGSFAADGSPRPGAKAAGIIARAKAVTPQVVDVACRLRVEPGLLFAPVADNVRSAIEGHLFGLGVFQDLIISSLSAAISSVAGVADLELLTPTANISTAFGARILPGAVTVTLLVTA